MSFILCYFNFSHKFANSGYIHQLWMYTMYALLQFCLTFPSPTSKGWVNVQCPVIIFVHQLSHTISAFPRKHNSFHFHIVQDNWFLVSYKRVSISCCSLFAFSTHNVVNCLIGYCVFPLWCCTFKTA